MTTEREQAGFATDEPHPQHYNFVRTFIPGLLSPERRTGFLAMLANDLASQRLQEAWQQFGAGVLPPEMLIPPTGLSVSGFHFEKFLCFLFVFPQPQAAGESYFGFLVAGPADDWSQKVREQVPVRYFILERSTSHAPEILAWRPSASEEDELFDALGPGPSPQNPPDFAEQILSRFYGLNSAEQ